jgi:hypothetical protein
MKRRNKRILKTTADEGLSATIEATSAMVSTTVSVCLVGPLGMIAGPVSGMVVGKIIKYVKGDFKNRNLSEWELNRINIIEAAALKQIQLNLKNGLQFRNDNFFTQESISDRAPVIEILEGTFIAAKNEHEEKKLDYIAYLYGNFSFHQEINQNHANYLVRIAERLSYHQFCILAFFNRKSEYHLRPNEIAQDTTHPKIENMIFREIEELKILSLLSSKNNYIMGGGPAGNITPSNVELSGTGKIFLTMMNLDKIDRSETDKVAELLGYTIK